MEPGHRGSFGPSLFDVEPARKPAAGWHFHAGRTFPPCFQRSTSLRVSPCRKPSSAISISPAPAISAISAAIPTSDGRTGSLAADLPLQSSRPSDRGRHRGAARPRRPERVRFSRPGGARRGALCGMREIIVHSLPVEPTVVAALRAMRAAGTALSPDDAVDVMRESYRNYVQQNTRALPRAVCASAGRSRAAGDPLHRRQGPHRLCLRADPACARRRRGRDRRGLPPDQPLLPARSVGQQRPSRRCQASAGYGGGLVSCRRVRSHRRRLWRSRKLSSGWPGPRAA